MGEFVKEDKAGSSLAGLPSRKGRRGTFIRRKSREKTIGKGALGVFQGSGFDSLIPLSTTGDSNVEGRPK